MTHDAITVLQERLAQPEQPVECMCGICKLSPRQWQGLTDEERNECIEWVISLNGTTFSASLAKAIEAKLKEKNG